MRKKAQIESASSRQEASLSAPIIFVIDARRLKESLYKNKFIIIGSIINAITIMAITPLVLLIMDILLATVLNASFIDEPTIGTKLLIANLAVFNERLS